MDEMSTERTGLPLAQDFCQREWAIWQRQPESPEDELDQLIARAALLEEQKQALESGQLTEADLDALDWPAFDDDDEDEEEEGED